MNLHRSAYPSRGAFTLLELLVVIAIIALLAGILLPVTSSVMDNAHKVQAKNTETQIVTAVKAFQTDYGVYPVTSTQSNNGTTDTVFGDSGNNLASALMDVLRADGYGNDLTLNPRRVVYFEMPTVKNTAKPANGIGTDGMPYDPWGKSYQIAIDSNYDNGLANPYGGNHNAGFDPVGTGVLVVSFGKDKQTTANMTGGGGDRNTGTSQDDVISWQ